MAHTQQTEQAPAAADATIGELAAAWGVSRMTIKRWVRAGLVEARVVGHRRRFRRSLLNEPAPNLLQRPRDAARAGSPVAVA